MKWNHKIGTLTVLLALGITMVGCGTPGSTAGSAAASTTSTTSSEAQKTEVQPMQGVLLSDPLSDGTYHISFESDKVWVGERKNTINDAVVYDYDRYTAPEIEALREGDTIATHLNGTEEITALTVESVERENNYVTINGGIEEGGIDLCKEDDHYRTLTWDDFPVYYEVGVAKQLVMADDIELSDGAADFEADPVIVKGDRAVCDAMSNEEDGYGWNAGNTTVTIQNGEMTHVDRIWVP
ncbi:hypothetical protein [Faecalibacterium hattorii]|uniref:hypothetical protein n=1 Tax=Faecalibacterium hattorii TaxID=2935520 RepID=UPI003AADCC0B